MSWIAPGTEARIHHLIRTTDMTSRAIAREVGCSANTVCKIRISMDVIKAWSADTNDEVLELLVSGLAAGAVSAKMNIPHEAIVDYAYVNRRKISIDSSRRRSLCGAAVPPPKGQLAIRKNSVPPDDISRGNVVALHGTVEEILQLNDTATITHPLFQSLVRRAERTIGKINGNEKREA